MAGYSRTGGARSLSGGGVGRLLVGWLGLLLVAFVLGPVSIADPPASATVGDPDLALFDPARGRWYLRYADGTIDDFYYGVPGDTPLMGDFDCDGVDTVAMYREKTGFIYLRNSNEFGVGEQEFFYGMKGDIPVVGDWDGDGCDTFGIYRRGRVFLSNELGTRPADVSFFFGIPGDRPFAGDFNGDGVDTIGLYRESSGFVYFSDTIPEQDGVAPTENQFFYGVPSDRIVAGDWDGDGDDSVGIFRPSERKFYLSLENRQGFADLTISFGENHWIPAAGRFGPAPGSPPDMVSAINWESLGGPPGAGRVRQLVQTTGVAHALFALNDHGIYRSTDKGETWELLPTPQPWIASMATRDDNLLVCGDGLHELANGSFHTLLADGCESVSAAGGTVVLANGSENQVAGVVKRSTSGGWQDLSPRASDLAELTPPSAGTEFKFRIPFLAPVGDDLLAAFIVSVAGSGEFTNGGLYRWDDAAASWSRLNLSVPAGVIPAKLIADQQNPLHVIAAFRHPILHEFTNPISQLVFESTDGGKTWASLTDAGMVSNGVTDVVTVGPSRYLLSPYDGYMLQVTGDTASEIRMPTVAEFPQQPFDLETILVDPFEPETAYGMAGTIWELGLLKSTDGMSTWAKMDRDIIASSPTIVVTHPTDPAVVLTSGNVIQEAYATGDGGATWDPFSPVRAGDELRADPHNPDHLLLVDEATVFWESRNGGLTFQRTAEEFTGSKVLDFEVTDDGSTIYISNLGVGISRLETNLPSHMINSPDYAYDLEIDPDDDGVVFATNSPKKFEDHSTIWRYSPDQASSFGWSEILRVEDSAGITSLRFDPSDANTMYAGVTGKEGTIWVSRDRGTTWEELNSALTFTTIQGHSQLDVSSQGRVLAGTWGGGTFRSTDGGRNWTMLDAAHTFSPTCLVSWPADPAIVYACDRTAPKIHKSLDGGQTWSEYFDFGPGHLTATALAIDPSDHDLIYAAAFRPPAGMLGSFYKIKAGKQVEDLGSGLPRAVIEIETDEQQPSTVYVTTHLHGLFHSDDGGNSWARLDDQGTGLPRTGFFDIDIDPHQSGTLYVSSLCGEIPGYVIDPLRGLEGTGNLPNIDPAAKCGVYKSTDGGASWSLVLETMGEAKGIDLAVSKRGHVYVADSAGGVWASLDGGISWSQENSGLPTTSVTSVRVGDSLVYAGTQGSGVAVGAIQSDGSITWRSDRSPRVYVYRVQIEVDPLDSSRLYASAYPGGVLRSDDGGLTWSAKNFLTPSIRVTDPTVQGYYALDIDPASPETVWLGVYGVGVIVSYDGRDFGTFANGSSGIMRGKHITSLQVDPDDSNRVVVGSEEGVYITTDGGKTWSALNDGLGTMDIRSLKVSDAGVEPFEADFDDGSPGGFELEEGWSVTNGALRGDGHYWARGGLETWTDYSFESKIELLAGGVHVNARVSDEGRYFVGIREGVIYLSRQFDEGKQFADLASIPAPVVLSNPHKVLVELDGPRIRVSLDGVVLLDYTDSAPLLSGSIAFESLDESSVLVDDVSVVPEPLPSQIHAGTNGYSLYTFDQLKQQWDHRGRTLGSGWWAPWSRRMYQFSSILFDPVAEGTVYHGHFPGGFFVSTDGGQTWRDSSVGLGNDGMFSLAQHPQERSVLFAGTYNGIVRSDDGGATWADSSSGMPPEQWPYTVAIDHENPNIMYTSTKNGQNQGFCQRNWGTFCGVVMKSTDGGLTWQKIMTGLNPRNEFYSLLIHPDDHDILFLSTSGGVFMSVDAGAAWWPINTGLPATNNQVRDNVADNLTFGAGGRYLYLGLVRHGVWRADLGSLR